MYRLTVNLPWGQVLTGLFPSCQSATFWASQFSSDWVITDPMGNVVASLN